MRTFAILGSGMAAFGAASTLAAEGIASTCYDKNAYYGGHTASFAHPDGFIFDDGPHVSFTTNSRIQELLADNVDQQFEQITARINNYWRGHWMPHPAQCNLHGLPIDLVTRIVSDFVDALQPTERPIRHYADWLEASFGETFARTFPMVYGLKYHTTPADNMSIDWLGPRMYRPTLDEVLRGALSATPQTDKHYVTHFRYPTRGGFVSYLRRYAERTDVRLCHRLVRLDARRRALQFDNGAEISYDRVISSIPLPDLVECLVEAPIEVRAAARRLAFTTAVIVNLGIERADLSAAHISYVYDPEIPFARINFPHMLSPHCVPRGKGSIQVEVYFSDKYRPLDRPPATLIEPVIDGLRRIGILLEDDAVLFSEARVVRHANIIYDLERTAAVDTVHAFLDEAGVYYCGRYGNWDHAWTDEAFESGERAAHAALA
jgi:protoporphyrinogen oxidase